MLVPIWTVVLTSFSCASRPRHPYASNSTQQCLQHQQQARAQRQQQQLQKMATLRAGEPPMFALCRPGIDITSSSAISVVIKVGMVGDSQIGKTSLMVKYVEGSFDEDYIQTLGQPLAVSPCHLLTGVVCRRQLHGEDNIRAENYHHLLNLGSWRYAIHLPMCLLDKFLMSGSLQDNASSSTCCPWCATMPSQYCSCSTFHANPPSTLSRSGIVRPEVSTRYAIREARSAPS